MESGRLPAQRRRNRSRDRGVRRSIMKFQLLPALAAIAALGAVAAFAAPVNYTVPEDTAAFKPGPNLDVVQNNCTACHSADYIRTQPRGEKFKKGFLAGGSDQDDQGLRRADRRSGCRQDRRLSRRDLLRSEARTPLEPSRLRAPRGGLTRSKGAAGGGNRSGSSPSGPCRRKRERDCPLRNSSARAPKMLSK